MQRRLNQTMKEVVRVEVQKLLDAGIIYPIVDSRWVSPTRVVPKKSQVAMVENENNELIPTLYVLTTGALMPLPSRTTFRFPFLTKFWRG